MMIKRYLSFVKESQDSIDSAAFDGIRGDIEKMIKDTVKDSVDVKDFANKYLNNPGQVEIEGLINDNQVYEFWQKYENEIDEILNKIGFFSESPDDVNALGTYKYIIASTKAAVKEVVKMLVK